MQRYWIGLGQTQKYDINGVHYVVSGKFAKGPISGKNTIRSCIKRILQSPVHLTLLPVLRTIDTESVRSTAGEED